MRRRDVLGFVGGAAAWPLAARAQQQKMPVVGFLNPATPEDFAQLLVFFHQGLREGGYVEGRNLEIEYRWARGRFDQLPALATDLVQRRVAVMVPTGGLATVRAARDAGGGKIPIVFSVGVDPVREGLVASLNRPGGNMTGVSVIGIMLGPKRVELLHDLVPNAKTIAALVNSSTYDTANDVIELRDAVHTLGKQIVSFEANSDSQIEAAFATMRQSGAGALFVPNNAFIFTRREKIIALARTNAIPAIYDRRDYTLDGGLMSYGAVLSDSYRQLGTYVGRLLRGEKPADLPVVQPTKFELVVNLKAAKAIGLTIPETFLVRADEVIE